MRNLAVEQRCQAMAAGNAIEECVRRKVLAGIPPSIPFRELIQRAAPNNLFLLVLDFAETILIERKCIGTAQQCPPARPFPFAILLFQLPRFQLPAAPAKIL